MAGLVCLPEPEEGKAKKFGFIAALPASRLFAFALNGGEGRPIIYLPMLCQKVSSIYHILTFSQSSQVSRGPNKESAPRATVYQAPKVKTWRSMKSPFSSRHTPREVYLHFLYVENI